MNKQNKIQKMTITKHTALRIERYCEVVRKGFNVPTIPASPYTYDELVGDSIEEKIEFYEEVKFATGKDIPSRADIRLYSKIFKDYGNSHDSRMDMMIVKKIESYKSKNKIISYKY